jgi:outer membrane protein assembly factor BamA
MHSDRMMISFDIVKVHLKNLKRIRNNLYVGIDYQFQKLYNQDVNLKTPMMCDLITGGMGYTASGIGPIFIYDKRNNPLNPSNGSYIESSLLHFDKPIGSLYKFTSFVLDIRKYNTLFKRLIWNGNAYFYLNKGEVPYRMLPTIGGARFLRGYYRGRFRDNNMIIVQQEFRMPIYKWFGIAAFGGVGSVAREIKDFSENTFHYNFGVGLRIRINEKENTNLRLDYGITKDTHGIYLVFAEAF